MNRTLFSSALSALLTLTTHPLGAHTLVTSPVHSHADGSAMTVSASPLFYLAGFIVVTLVLHVIGAASGHPLFPRSRTELLRAGGLSLAGVSVWLLIGL